MGAVARKTGFIRDWMEAGIEFQRMGSRMPTQFVARHYAAFAQPAAALGEIGPGKGSGTHTGYGSGTGTRNDSWRGGRPVSILVAGGTWRPARFWAKLLRYPGTVKSGPE